MQSSDGGIEMEAKTKNSVEEETCFFRDRKRGIGNSLLCVEIVRLPPFVTVKLSPFDRVESSPFDTVKLCPFVSLQIESKIISNSDNINNQPQQLEPLLYQN